MGRNIAEDKKQKLWMVSELFYPDETSTAYILSKIANKLTNKFDVNVICGPTIYDKDKKNINTFIELSKDIKIIRKESITNKNNLLLRLITTFFLSFRLFKSVYKKVKSDDTIFIVTNPPLLMLLVSRLKKKRKFRLVILVHDVFPENTIPAKIFSSTQNIFYRKFKNIFDRAYAQADTLIVLGEDMKEIISQKIKKYSSETEVVIIQNWAETDLIYPIEKNVTSEIEILFAGNLGRVQGLKEFLELITPIKNSAIKYTFAGSGSIKSELIEYVKKKNITNIYFQPPFPREEQINILNNCDICLITLLDEMYGLGVPSKTYNILAAGKPILFIGNKKSEIAQMIQENHVGFVFSFEETDLLTNFLTQLSATNLPQIREMGKQARKLAENYFSEEFILNKFLAVI
ncbi:glycosyltransferase WbuB [Paludibacter sp. 221]|uniref:glycosyltransferase family 4 protein n=1 Tax=Paludibacter sp. 221 TaxID=2302939 RepID=UPI0013D0F695|nr:glycosyltransferase family 4 protein [Paludibacter sp. 221]NDV47263.1 glycosyltransferase WbuB [Paludibacter sp. 221]